MDRADTKLVLCFAIWYLFHKWGVWEFVKERAIDHWKVRVSFYWPSQDGIHIGPYRVSRSNCVYKADGAYQYV